MPPDYATSRIACFSASDTVGCGNTIFSTSSDAHFHFDHLRRGYDEFAREIPMACTPRISPYRAPASTFTMPVPPSFSTRITARDRHGNHAFLYSIPRAFSSFFRPSDARHLRVSVDDGGNRFVADPVRLAEHVVDRHDSFPGRRVGQLPPSRSRRRTPRHRGCSFSLFVDLDPLPVKIDPRSCSSNPSTTGAPSRGIDESVRARRRSASSGIVAGNRAASDFHHLAGCLDNRCRFSSTPAAAGWICPGRSRPRSGAAFQGR